MRRKQTYPIRAPMGFVFDWMTTPEPGDTQFTPGLTKREITEKWKLQYTTKDEGTIAGRRYASKAVLRKYPPRRWRLEEEAGPFYHRTEFSLSETPEGCEMTVEVEVIVRGLLKVREKAFRDKLNADFEKRVLAWIDRVEQEAKSAAAPATPVGPAADFNKKEAPRDIPRQYGS